MDTFDHESYQRRLSSHLKRWRKRYSRRLDPAWLEAALILLRLDLDPLRPSLSQLYSSSPRGRPPLDPVLMLRALLLMTILRFSSIPKFADELRRSKRLALIAGFQPYQTPACGTFYSFIDRLEDGPFTPSCPHRVKPSLSRKRPLLRNLHQEKADKEARRKAILQECDSITEHLKQQLLASSSLPRPSDLQSRLEDLFISSAVKPSADRGLLGDLNSLVLSGDGSALESGTASTGRATCSCRSMGIYKCKCSRLYRDTSADWGYDSYRETYYFGHTFYQHCVSTSGHDLPVHITIGPASESDFTLSLKSIDRLQKAFSDNGLEVKLNAVSYDSGHDALGIYEYLSAKSIKPVIALNPRNGHPSATGTAERINDEGVPVCEAGLPMRRHSRGKQD